jgi:7,8-dihydro-6-hydroxymethylpterin dimethyltransferase
MCMHNAKRDAYILRPVRVATAEGAHLWDPLTGVTTAGEVAKASFPSRALAPQDLPRKYLKGRQRQAILHDSETSRSDSV